MVSEGIGIFILYRTVANGTPVNQVSLGMICHVLVVFVVAEEEA